MGHPQSLRRLARIGAALAGLVGAYHVLSLLGAFGPVTCWEGTTQGGSATQNGTVTTTTPQVTRGCESGIDALLGAGGPPGGGNAATLLAWAAVLLALVAVGVAAVWTERRFVAWLTVGVGAAVTVVGVFSIGWYFLLPTLFLSVSATALSVKTRYEA